MVHGSLEDKRVGVGLVASIVLDEALHQATSMSTHTADTRTDVYIIR